jgi:hypothetical protein
VYLLLLDRLHHGNVISVAKFSLFAILVDLESNSPLSAQNTVNNFREMENVDENV